MFENTTVDSPKLKTSDKKLVKYYAGYSSQFVDSIIKTTALGDRPTILDPWNGIGTTTTQANRANIKSIGCDINPVMTLYAKASLLNMSDKISLMSICDEILRQVELSEGNRENIREDTLLDWFAPSSVLAIRNLEAKIKKLLLSDVYSKITDSEAAVSSYASFFYVCLFSVLKKLALRFRGSNPTWLKKPKHKRNRVRPNQKYLNEQFKQAVTSNIALLTFGLNSQQEVDLRVRSSLDTGIMNQSVDLVITSPPYCTRIDYAITTQIELALLRYSKSQFRKLRNSMIGTSTIFESHYEYDPSWGSNTNQFLNKIQSHESKASSSYYFKSHYQYYSSMYRSLKHLSDDVIKTEGGLVMVVQDSYYKEIHNDLQGNLTDMAKYLGLELTKRIDFPNSRSMATIHKSSKNYRKRTPSSESVICFIKR